MAQNVLIIFIKNPVLGKVKTRLARDIGDERALEVYHSLLRKCRTECLNVNAKRYLYYFDEVLEDDKWDPVSFSKKLQSSGDLGEKMRSAFEEINELHKESSMVLIGSDCYDLDERIIMKAFDRLQTADLVLGPANDGGYYLIGMNRPHAKLFENIPWSTSTVLAQTIEKAECLNLTYSKLEELIDLDTFDDLKMIRE